MKIIGHCIFYSLSFFLGLYATVNKISYLFLDPNLAITNRIKNLRGFTELVKTSKYL